jgi:hypothetical protein
MFQSAKFIPSIIDQTVAIKGNADQEPNHSFGNPRDGQRLVRAFLNIRDRKVREAVISFVEQLASAR